jgi:hypothetical protein
MSPVSLQLSVPAGCGRGIFPRQLRSDGARFASLDANAQAKLRSDVVRLWSRHNRAVGNSTEVSAEYLEIIAARG